MEEKEQHPIWPGQPWAEPGLLFSPEGQLTPLSDLIEEEEAEEDG